jgi:hypothetical protein
MLLGGNIIIPSLYSYFLKINKKIPSPDKLQIMFDFYLDYECYLKDFSSLV